MRIILGTILAFSSLIYGETHALTPYQWSVQPKVCIVKTLGEECEMELTIAATNLPEGRYCYYQDDTRLSCWQSSDPLTSIRVSFTQNTTLTLRDAEERILLTHEMQVKARQASNKTRRVREPWSLF